jgi:hypothetical protein
MQFDAIRHKARRPRRNQVTDRLAMLVHLHGEESIHGGSRSCERMAADAGVEDRRRHDAGRRVPL